LENLPKIFRGSKNNFNGEAKRNPAEKKAGFFVCIQTVVNSSANLYIQLLLKPPAKQSMSLAHETDTIAAIATPEGEGGIAVIRISGDGAMSIAARGFRGAITIDKMSSRTAHYGRFVDEHEETIDNVVALAFRRPNSYTGEDTVELSCHGGRYLAKRILEAALRFGARAAQAGEFTKRAFLNGRIDLAQAEAVADLIHARSERAHQSSLAQLNGVLSDRVSQVRERLVESIGLLELELDFAEDGYEFTEKAKVVGLVRSTISQINRMLSTYSVGRIYRDGVKVVLAGAPNVGKSSLLNALLQEDRAIVTEIPGTTRDIIEESISLGGLLFNLIDTAGIRETEDLVEREGVRRAEERLSNCDILVLMLDCTRPVGVEERTSIVRLTEAVEQRGASCVFVLNKIDVLDLGRNHVPEEDYITKKHDFVEISAKTHQGLETLKDLLVKKALSDMPLMSEGGVTITNARHFSALKRTAESLELALETLEFGKSGEFVTVDLRAGLDALGEIVGATSTDDILDSIFSRFCIGK
jgi:tRNA modification GTPase